MLQGLYGKIFLGLATLGLLPKPNLRGDRQVEWSWVAAHLGGGSGELLDFGSGGSVLGLLAARLGYQVTAIDLEAVSALYRHPRFRHQHADLFKLDVAPETFDVIINCSSVEHVGLAHRYGIRQPQPDGDLQAMTILRRLLKPSGRMLLTLPVGRDAVVAPLHRVYGPSRLPPLLRGWTIEQQEYWIKDCHNQWVIAEEARALELRPRAWLYALGLFVLRPSGGNG